jgi:regulator of sirC expression with transglutaminase-like and TPR domain
MSASTRRQEVERTPQILVVNPTLSSEMMFGSNHKSYYHSDQLLLFRS